MMRDLIVIRQEFEAWALSKNISVSKVTEYPGQPEFLKPYNGTVAIGAWLAWQHREPADRAPAMGAGDLSEPIREGLPPLPRPAALLFRVNTEVAGYTAGQMQDYARAALAQRRAASGAGDLTEDAARWRCLIDWQERGEQPEAMLEMWRKVYAENRLKPTSKEFADAIDAVRATANGAAGQKENNA